MKKFCLALMLLISFQLFADDDKLRLAVMEFEDRSGSLSKQVLSDATEYLRGALISANKYIVIAQERQSQAMVKDMKKESYKECNDKNCQIQLGQALSADTILRTTITRLGKTFVIASELIDLEKEATVVGAREKYDGTEESLSIALDNIAEKVIAVYESTARSSAYHRVDELSDNTDTAHTYHQVDKISDTEANLKESELEAHKEIESYNSNRKSRHVEWSSTYLQRKSWDKAQEYCQNLNEGGHNDWRLPTIDEWRSTFQNCPATQPEGECRISEINNMLTPETFSRACKAGCRKGSGDKTIYGKGWFWSSSRMENTDSFFVIAFKYARISHLTRGGLGSVRCVR